MKQVTPLRAASDLQDKDEPIFQALLTAIVEHRLPPGSKLPEEALSATFGVSRTGIRKVLQRLAAVQMVTLLPRRGAQVATPGAVESRDIFRTRALLECANLDAVVAHSRPADLAALRALSAQEARAHQQQDGTAAIRLSAQFHLRLQAIAGNRVLNDLVTRLTQRSSLAIAAWGAPWQQGCRCDDHDRLIALLDQRDLPALQSAMRHHFDHIVASLRFGEVGDSVPDFARLFPRQ
ncbi:GntR family transcriptional regulator [Pantoea sp. 1.19]|uniref:GntR family transcriptional regulator n=1 Tax=Pantoea sp. 1.19 TaxID=1925589 RepID=UPI000948F4EA|nr:GntR family transcriptional regulator [Pantoea sp. 1.19]